MSFIKINNLYFNYQEVSILNNINLHIDNNDFISILGPSGCGKSTILKILAKILTNYKGDISIDSIPLTNYNYPCAYMPQDHLLLPWKNLLDNLTIPLLLKGVKKSIAKKKVLSFLEEFSLLHLEKRYPHELSGGQKQRSALLRTILINSNILLLDEPFSQLDNVTKIKFHKFLYQIYSKYNSTVILVTHDIDEAIFLSNKIYIINKKGYIYNNFSINLPYPRNEETIINNSFLEYKKNITKALLGI